MCVGKATSPTTSATSPTTSGTSPTTSGTSPTTSIAARHFQSVYLANLVQVTLACIHLLTTSGILCPPHAYQLYNLYNNDNIYMYTHSML